MRYAHLSLWSYEKLLSHLHTLEQTLENKYARARRLTEMLRKLPLFRFNKAKRIEYAWDKNMRQSRLILDELYATAVLIDVLEVERGLQ